MTPLKSFLKKKLMIFLTIFLITTSVQFNIKVEAAERIDCIAEGDYTSQQLNKAQAYIKQLGIPQTSKGKSLNIGYLLNECGLGDVAVVYGSPKEIPKSTNNFEEGQWRYLGWDLEGNLYRNWMFRSDSRATLNVAKNWVKKPWNTNVGDAKGITKTRYSDNEDIAASWLNEMVDPYKESKTFLQSYNKRKGTNWTGYDLLDYAIIQQPRTNFSPGVVQMWNIWQPDGSWWYEMFVIKPDIPEFKEQPDLIIDPLTVQNDAFVDDAVSVKITTKNQGEKDSGPFTVGIVGTNIKSEVISNVPPGQIKTVTIKVTSAVSGIIKYTAMTDFGQAVVESNENNNTKPFQIAFNKKNEPTTPVAIISHLEGDHRTEPEITIKPSANPKLDDILSYSPGKEAITIREWKYRTPSGTTIQKKPVAKDFIYDGKYVVELRVSNRANKISEWAQLIVNVTDKATPHPSATPTPTPVPTPTPRPELKASVRFVPDTIIAGEKSSLLNSSIGFDSFEWTFTSNLDSLLPNKNELEYYDRTFTQPGTYRATFKAIDDSGYETSMAILNVIDPKPVAVVAGITKVTEGRPFPFPYHLNNSYTPLADRGATIDHSKSEKRYKKVGATEYINGFPTVNNLALGQYTLEGKVYDTTGRVSEWADLLLEVVPDLPPTIEVTAPVETYRNNGFMLYIEAESPDYDGLEHLLLQERYDRNGNGDFEEEAWKTIYDGAYKTTHSLNYTAVGKRQYRATVTEDYGKKGSSSIAITDVLNYAPTVNFNAFGTTQQPGQDEDSGPPVINYTSESIYRSWVYKKPYVGGDGDKLAWKTAGTSISTKVGEKVNFNLKYPDAGMGLNSRNKYTLATDLVLKPTWVIQPLRSDGQYDMNYGLAAEIIFEGKRVYTYRNAESVLAPDGGCCISKDTLMARDAITGELLRPAFDIRSIVGYAPSIELKEDERFYSFNKYNVTTVASIDVFDGFGKAVDAIQFNIPQKTGWVSLSQDLTLTPDLKSLIFSIKYQSTNSYDQHMDYLKYNFESRQVQWIASSPTSYTRPNTYYEDKYSFAGDGTIYITGQVVTKITPNGARIDSPLVSGNPEGSSTSISDDGQYLYRMNNLTRDSNDTRTDIFTIYRTSDLSIVNQYSSFESYEIGYGYNDYYSKYNPVVKSDGNIAITQRSTLYLFSKTGTLLLKSQIFPDVSMTLFSNRNFQPFMLNNGDLFSVVRRQDTNYNISVLNITKGNYTDMQIVENGSRWAGILTPVLPNGSFFGLDNHSYPHRILAFVSKSSKTNLQDIDANTVGIFDDDWGGLVYDAGSIMKNYAFEFNVSINDVKNDKPIGAGFNIQNEKSMNAIEWTKDTLTLYKVVNGVKTSLNSIPLARSPYVNYPVKVESINGVLSVHINHVKVIEVADATYTKGAAGIMSLGQSSASFSNVKKTNYGDTYTQQTYDSVLVNDPISYEKLFSDIENDPMGMEEWSYTHNPNFFENPEGLSIHNGKAYGSTINALEKPGVYEITFRAKDNPGLSAYSKWSEPVKKWLYVHRRPISQPDVRFTGKVFAEGEALDYDTYDTSYDPDIAHILSDKLFRTRWADESKWTTGKRAYYNRPGVELIVQEQVRDIHGAWSYWGQTIVYKNAIPAINQTKPVMTITSPAGLTAAAPTVLINEPIIKWTYYDKENDPQESYRLMITYVDNNETALYIEHEGKALTYPMLADSIVPGRVVKIQGQVYSTGVWSDLSNIRYFVLDLPPETFLLSFNGSNAASPIYTNSNRPQLRVFTVDPENHPITAIDYEIYKASNGSRVVDTNSLTSSTSYTPPALAEGLHYWKARANDSYLWGPYSTNGFFFVDTVKPADVDEKLEVEPTAVTVKFNAFSDAEPSSGHATRTFYLQKVNANGSVTNIDLNGDGTTEYSIPLALHAKSYRVSGLAAGQEYRLTVLDYDVAGNEGHYAYIHFVTNRPPTGDFDWSPKPVYEGDTVQFRSEVDDADGNSLDVAFELINPSGQKSQFAYRINGPVYPQSGPLLQMKAVGTWTVKMTVSDGIAPPVIVNKTVQVLPLHVAGYVKHTEQWDQHRMQYNIKKTGNKDSPRAYSVFWAGEKFILEANTTVTGTATRAERVEVKMGSYSALLAAKDSTGTFWNGELWDAAFDKLEDGKQIFSFTAYYNNGTVKIDTVEVSIEGQTLNIVGVHRVQ